MVIFPSVWMDFTLVPSHRGLGCSAANGFWDFCRTWPLWDHFSFEHRTVLAVDSTQEPRLSQPPRVLGALKHKLCKALAPGSRASLGRLAGAEGAGAEGAGARALGRSLQSHYFDTFLFSFGEQVYPPASWLRRKVMVIGGTLSPLESHCWMSPLPFCFSLQLTDLGTAPTTASRSIHTHKCATPASSLSSLSCFFKKKTKKLLLWFVLCSPGAASASLVNLPLFSALWWLMGQFWRLGQ